jgi:TonB family protein
MKLIFLLLIFFTTLQIYSQQMPEPQYYDKENKRVYLKEDAAYYKLVFHDTSDSSMVRVEEYSLADKLESIGNISVEKNTKEGKWIFYHNNGKKRLEGNFVDGKDEGKFLKWYLDGNLRSETNYKNNEYHGRMIWYFPNGAVQRNSMFVEGEETESNCFDEAGNRVTCPAFEVLPVFPGGMAALNRFVSKTCRYPRKSKVLGKVVVRFVINEDGSISGIEVMKSVSPELDKEAMRVVSLMPNWTPGLQAGEPVKVRYTMPINFTLLF